MQATPIQSWVPIVALTIMPLALLALAMLGRRLRVTEPELWETLGRPLAPRPDFSLASSIRIHVALLRLMLFPFQPQSFGSPDARTNLLLWVVRGAVAIGLALLGWMWVTR